MCVSSLKFNGFKTRARRYFDTARDGLARGAHFWAWRFDRRWWAHWFLYTLWYLYALLLLNALRFRNALWQLAWRRFRHTFLCTFLNTFLRFCLHAWLNISINSLLNTFRYTLCWSTRTLNESCRCFLDTWLHLTFIKKSFYFTHMACDYFFFSIYLILPLTNFPMKLLSNFLRHRLYSLQQDPF